VGPAKNSVSVVLKVRQKRETNFTPNFFTPKFLYAKKLFNGKIFCPNLQKKQFFLAKKT